MIVREAAIFAFSVGVLASCSGASSTNPNLALRCAEDELGSPLGFGNLERGEASEIIDQCKGAMKKQATLDASKALGRNLDEANPADIKVQTEKMVAVRRLVECHLHFDRKYLAVENGERIWKSCNA